MTAAAARRDRLRRYAIEAGLDGVLVWSWRRPAVAWFTGYHPGFVTNWAALWLPATGEEVLAVRFPFERARATAASGLAAVSVEAPWYLVPDGATSVGVIGGDLGVNELPHAVVAGLSGRGIKVEDLTGLLIQWQAVKSAEEVDDLRRAAAIGAAVLEAATAAEGDSDFAIGARAEAVAREAGALRCLTLVGIGPGDFVTEPSGRVARHGDPVCFEVTLQTATGCTHVNTAVRVGGGEPEGLRLCADVRARLLGAMQPGALVDDVVAVGDDALADAGMLDFKEYDFGHGLGLDTPEHPRLVRGTGVRLAPGMVAAVHVAVREPNGPTAFVGGPVVVTASGAEELCPGAPWARLS